MLITYNVDELEQVELHPVGFPDGIHVDIIREQDKTTFDITDRDIDLKMVWYPDTGDLAIVDCDDCIRYTCTLEPEISTEKMALIELELFIDGIIIDADKHPYPWWED